MIDVTFLRNYAERLKEAIDTINYKEVIVDDSQLVNMLDNIETSKKHLLFMVLPDFSNSGRNVDDIRKRTDTVILVLQKTSYSDITHDEFLDIMQETLLSAKAIETKMIADMLDYTEAGCMYMKQLNVPSISIQPVWGLAECNGWSLEFNFESD